MQRRSRICLLTVGILSAACADAGGASRAHDAAQSDTDDDDTSVPEESGAPASDRDTGTLITLDGGIECCPPSSEPGCCMAYGGARLNNSCSHVCDGMPSPADPAWKLVNDAYGCPRWSSLGHTYGCCGSPAVHDGGQRSSCYGDYGEPPQPIDAGR